MKLIGLFFFSFYFFSSIVFAEKLVTGYGHSCAIKKGQLYCWGLNDFGQLGLGHKESVGKAQWVEGLPGEALEVTSYRTHTCALSTEGVFCWGSNTFGWLGVGDRRSRDLPTRVLGIPEGSKVSSLSAGYGHTCAVVDQGVMCWGWNRSCQLGKSPCLGGENSTQDYVMQARWVDQLGPGHSVKKVVSAFNHTCALVKQGQKCWGWNLYGRLGNSKLDQRYYPVPQWSKGMGASAGVSDIAAGDFTGCVVLEGDLICYGRGILVGRGHNVKDGHVPTLVKDLNVDVGPFAPKAHKGNTCVITRSHRVFCFGINHLGQLANESFETTLKPTVISGLPVGQIWTEVSIGQAHACVQNDAGEVWCWGWNGFCQLGNGTCNQVINDIVPQPNPVVGL